MDESNFEEDQEQSDETPADASGDHKIPSNESYEDLYGQLAQKDRDLVLAAELGKALLESNQELQRRYDAMYEEYSSKVESLQQEKYNLHLEIEKVETEHQNKFKDLQDDILTLREQLKSSNQHQNESEVVTSRSLHEAKRKSDYLAEQVQQANKTEEELKEELENEKAKNETNLCVIQDHLEHINMLREQVEYLSEKLKETTQTLLGVQDERDRLLAINEKNLEKLKSLESTMEQQNETITSQESQIKQLEAQLSKAKKTPTQIAKQPNSQSSQSTTTLPSHQSNTRSKTRNSNNNRPQPLDQPHCYSETISNSSQLAPLSAIVTDYQGINTPQLSPQSLFRDDFGSSESLIKSLPLESSLLSEFSSSIRHHRRNKSDCSIVSLSEGSRKRHHETIAGGSDDEAESSDKSSKSSVCKQTLYSELMECGSGFVPISSNHDVISEDKQNLPMDLDILQSKSRSDYPTPPPEINFYSSCNLKVSSSNPSTPHSLASSTPLTPPEDNDIIDNLLQSSHPTKVSSEQSHHAPVTQEASLFEELSSKLSDLDHQNSNTSEKSLFDELSGQMNHHHRNASSSDLPSLCLLGHPDYHSIHSDGQKGECYRARQSEASLCEELSSKLSDLDRQNSNTSEKSLFDELSGQMNHHHRNASSSDLPSSCLLGHPDYHSTHSDGQEGECHGARHSEDDNSYTCEWPLLTSVSADMLDGDDFECDDDDFLVGNVAGSTLSIGDSGVGIMLNNFSTKAESSDVMTRQSWEYHRGDSWTGRMDLDVTNKQDLQEACRQMQELVDRLHGDDREGGDEDLSSPENELPAYGMGGGHVMASSSFDQLFSLIKQARQCVDDMQHGGVSHLRKFSARQWQLEEMDSVVMMDDFKIPIIECTNTRHNLTATVSSSSLSQASSLPHWTKRKELKRSSSSSSLTIRRSL